MRQINLAILITNIKFISAAVREVTQVRDRCSILVQFKLRQHRHFTFPGSFVRRLNRDEPDDHCSGGGGPHDLERSLASASEEPGANCQAYKRHRERRAPPSASVPTEIDSQRRPGRK